MPARRPSPIQTRDGSDSVTSDKENHVKRDASGNIKEGSPEVKTDKTAPGDASITVAVTASASEDKDEKKESPGKDEMETAVDNIIAAGEFSCCAYLVYGTGCVHFVRLY